MYQSPCVVVPTCQSPCTAVPPCTSPLVLQSLHVSPLVLQALRSCVRACVRVIHRKEYHTTYTRSASGELPGVSVCPVVNCPTPKGIHWYPKRSELNEAGPQRAS